MYLVHLVLNLVPEYLKELVILSGTQELDLELNELSTIDLNISIKLSILLREGGKDNYLKFLKCINLIVNNFNKIPEKYLIKTSYPDPYYYDWKNENGSKVGIISYKSLFFANLLINCHVIFLFIFFKK